MKKVIFTLIILSFFIINSNKSLAQSNQNLMKSKEIFSAERLPNNQVEINIKNAQITNIIQEQIYCIKSPCAQQKTITFKILGITAKANINPVTKILSKKRKNIELSDLEIGDYINIYGFQNINNPQIIDIQIMRNLSQSKISTKNTQKQGQFCAQVIVTAKNNITGELKDFPTPCDVPSDWTPIKN